MKMNFLIFVMVIASAVTVYGNARKDDVSDYVFLYKFQENGQHLERKSISIAMPLMMDSPRVDVAGTPIEFSLLESNRTARIRISPKSMSGIIKVSFKPTHKESRLLELENRFVNSVVKSNNCGISKKSLLDWPVSTVKSPDNILEILNHGLNNFNNNAGQGVLGDCSLSPQSLNAYLWSQSVASDYVEKFSYISAYNPQKGGAIAASSLSSWFVFKLNGNWFGMQLDGLDPLKLVEIDDLIIVDNERVVSSGYKAWQL